MKKNLALFSLLMLCLLQCAAQQIAFPGAEGFGKYASGGRGGKVVTVTNLQDTGVGSLRWALDQYVDTQYVYKDAANPSVPITIFQPLTVVFAVSGTIYLKSDLKIKRDNLTIAGQTAPCGGICITKRSVLLNGATTSQQFYFGPRRKNVILRYLRFRPDVPLDTAGQPTSAFVTYGLDLENYENVIIDHCSISWANEECLATYDCKNTSIQWCIVNEGLYNAYHIKGLRGYGGVWGGQYASFQYNLLAHQNNRTPRWNGARAHDTIAIVDYCNNINYNWGTSSAPYGGDVEINGGIARLNLRNNYYKPGPATPSTHKLVRPDYSSIAIGVGRFHVSGNVIEGNAARTANNWLAVDFVQVPTASRDSSRSDTAFTITAPLSNMLTAQQAYDTILKYAGAIYPQRDTVDLRIANEVRNRTASGTGTAGRPGIIDAAAAVGGLPNYPQCTGPTDSDADGMPDDWEIAQQLNPYHADDRNIVGTDGYTMLEQYINGLTTYNETKKGCSNRNIALASDVPGSSYEWEVDRGNGFTIMSGQTDSVLQLQLPTSAYGYQYRCRVNGYRYSRTFTIKFETTWTGAADNAWENPANWSCNQVPDANTDVLIVNGQVLVSSAAECRMLRVVSPAASVTVQQGYSLRSAE